jgi:hypothetical protein
MAARLGMKGFVYRNTGTYASPVWAAVNNVKDLTLTLEKGEADVTTRNNDGWRATIGTLKDASVEFQMVYDPEDTQFTAIRDAWLANTAIELLILDGGLPANTNGDLPTTPEGQPLAQGLRASFGVLTFSRTEALEDAMMVDVSIKPTYAVNAPAWFTATAPT